MKLIVLLFLLIAAQAHAVCSPVDCMMRGGECVGGQCVMAGETPTPSNAPATTPIILPEGIAQITNVSDFSLMVIQKFFCDSKTCIIVIAAPETKK